MDVLGHLTSEDSSGNCVGESLEHSPVGINLGRHSRVVAAMWALEKEVIYFFLLRR